MLKQCSVFIIGAGPVGMALACLLDRYGVSAIVVDRLPAIQTDPRAITLDNEALRILQMCGLVEGDLDVLPIGQVNYVSPIFGRFARMNTAEHKDCHPALVTFFQPDLERALEARIGASSCVELLRCYEATSIGTEPDQHTIQLMPTSDADLPSIDVNARFVVACDGASSPTRQQLGIAFDGVSYSQDWLIVDALGVPEAVHDVTFYCDPTRPAPHMPAPGGRQRWEFMLHEGEAQAEFLKDQTIRKLLRPWTSLDSIVVERKAIYRFHARIAAQFSRDSVFLAGDAAHVTPPFAGQGLVSGLRDVANLAWKLTWVDRGYLPVAVLSSYDLERKPHARKMIKLAQFLGALIMPASQFKALLVHGLARFVTLLPVIGQTFTDLKIKPQNRFDAGLFTPSTRGELIGTGNHLPQWFVRTREAESVRSDDFFGQSLAIVGFDCDPMTALSKDRLAQWQAIGGQTFAMKLGNVAHDMPFRSTSALLTAPEAKPLSGRVMIVRPDRVILAESRLATLNADLTEVLALLGQPEITEPIAC